MSHPLGSAGQFQKALLVNSEATRFEPDGIGDMTETEPSGTGNVPREGTAVIDNSGTAPADEMCLLPFGEGQPYSSFWIRVWGWNKLFAPARGGTVRKASLEGDCWVPLLLGEFFCRLSNRKGLKNCAIQPHEYACDTILMSRGDGFVISHGQNLIAFAHVMLHGVHKIQFQIVTNDGALGNTLWAFM